LHTTGLASNTRLSYIIYHNVISAWMASSFLWDKRQDIHSVK